MNNLFSSLSPLQCDQQSFENIIRNLNSINPPWRQLKISSNDQGFFPNLTKMAHFPFQPSSHSLDGRETAKKTVEFFQRNFNLIYTYHLPVLQKIKKAIHNYPEFNLALKQLMLTKATAKEQIEHIAQVKREAEKELSDLVSEYEFKIQGMKANIAELEQNQINLALEIEELNLKKKATISQLDKTKADLIAEIKELESKKQISEKDTLIVCNDDERIICRMEELEADPNLYFFSTYKARWVSPTPQDKSDGYLNLINKFEVPFSAPSFHLLLYFLKNQALPTNLPFEKKMELFRLGCFLCYDFLANSVLELIDKEHDDELICHLLSNDDIPLALPYLQTIYQRLSMVLDHFKDSYYLKISHAHFVAIWKMLRRHPLVYETNLFMQMMKWINFQAEQLNQSAKELLYKGKEGDRLIDQLCLDRLSEDELQEFVIDKDLISKDQAVELQKKLLAHKVIVNYLANDKIEATLRVPVYYLIQSLKDHFIFTLLPGNFIINHNKPFRFGVGIKYQDVKNSRVPNFIFVSVLCMAQIKNLQVQSLGFPDKWEMETNVNYWKYGFLFQENRKLGLNILNERYSNQPFIEIKVSFSI